MNVKYYYGGIAMDMNKKIDMIIDMVANMNETMTVKFEQIDERFDRIDEKFDQIDERFDRIDERFERIENRVERLENQIGEIENRLTNVEGSVESLRIENAQQHDLLRGQIGAVAEALNASNAMHDARYAELEAKCEELKAKDAALEQVQEQHSIDIMALRAAM